MQYIIYGTDTNTVLGLDEAVILLVPDELGHELDGEDFGYDFAEYLEKNYNFIQKREIAPLEDVYESLALAMGAEGIPPETVGKVIATLNDAMANNLY